jgi:hypothetical protein
MNEPRKRHTACPSLSPRLDLLPDVAHTIAAPDAAMAFPASAERAEITTSVVAVASSKRSSP